MEKIIIYGAGEQGRAVRRILESQGFNNFVFADRDTEKVQAGEWERAKIIGLDKLKTIDKLTPIIIGIGANRVDLLESIDKTLVDYGFVNIFYSAVEFFEKMLPNFKLEPTFYGFEFSPAVGCSVDCKWCAQKLFTAKYSERLKNQSSELPKDRVLSWDNFLKILDKIPRDKNIQIDFSGYAEPYLNPRTTDMIIETVNRGFGVQLYTTLQGMTHNDIDRLSKIRFAHIVPHLADKDGNAKIPVDDEYLALLINFFKTFDYAIGYTNNLLVRGVSYHGELHPKVADALEKEGVNIRGYSNFSGVTFPIAGCVSTGDTLNYNHNYAIQCGQIGYCDTKYINKDDKKFFDEKMHMHGICFPNGDVLACSRAYAYDFLLGNLLQSDYYDLFDGNPAYEKMLADQRNPAADILCRTCEFAIPRSQMTLVTK